MALTMGLNIADRRLRYRIGEKHMCVKDGTRGLPIADCDIASAGSIAHMYSKRSGADCDIADSFIASGLYHVVH
jgi:hypothetical protein